MGWLNRGWGWVTGNQVGGGTRARPLEPNPESLFWGSGGVAMSHNFLTRGHAFLPSDIYIILYYSMGPSETESLRP
jgi:hypothetical protein